MINHVLESLFCSNNILNIAFLKKKEAQLAQTQGAKTEHRLKNQPKPKPIEFQRFQLRTLQTENFGFGWPDKKKPDRTKPIKEMYLLLQAQFILKCILFLLLLSFCFLCWILHQIIAFGCFEQHMMICSLCIPSFVTYRHHHNVFGFQNDVLGQVKCL